MVDPSPVIFDDLRSRRGRPAFFPDIYDRELELLPLYPDPESGEEHYLARYPKGLKARWPRHSAAHTMIILEGQMEAKGRRKNNILTFGAPLALLLSSESPLA